MNELRYPDYNARTKVFPPELHSTALSFCAPPPTRTPDFCKIFKLRDLRRKDALKGGVDSLR